MLVARDVAQQMVDGERRVFGMMIESHLVGGRQDLVPDQPLTYGQSITDGCVGWDDTVAVLDVLAEAVQARRGVLVE
jgi:3-deoxy-7-phosphoheptulonate synthase